MKFIGVYIGSIEELRFFIRLADALYAQGYKFCFFSNKLSLILRLFLSKYNFQIIYKSAVLTEIPDLSKCFEYRMGFISYEEAQVLYSSVFNTLIHCTQQLGFEYIFIWNGLTVQTMAVSKFAGINKIKTRYFELSNLPGKIFADIEGVNAYSRLYSDVSILYKYQVKSADYEDWKNHYLQWKTNQNKSKSINRNINFLFPLDLIGFRLLNMVKSGETRLLNKFKERLIPGVDVMYDDYDLRNGRYILLPLQVNNDSQIIFNSEIDNLAAIEIAGRKASILNADLLVKIHPLEFDKMFIRQLLLLKEQYKFFIINYNLTELLKYTVMVMCINSTAGLEAKIMGKETEFLGRSFYALFTEELMRNYILGYLLNTEYVSEEIIEAKVIDKLLRLEQ